MFALFYAFLLLPCLQGAPSFRKSMELTKKFPVRIEGHRGVGHLEPENTFKAFQRAIDLGIDGIELDIWLTKDLVPVVAHGKAGGLIDLENGQQEYITKVNVSDLLEYTLKNGEKILKLEEVLDFCKDKISLNIDIKDIRKEVVEVVMNLLQAKKMLDQITFSSFLHRHRKYLLTEVDKRKILSPVNFGYLMDISNPVFPNYNSSKPGDSVIFDIRYLEKHRENCLAEIEKALEKEVKVKFWFPMHYRKENKYYDDLLKLGADTIITNMPLSLIEHFEKDSSDN